MHPSILLTCIGAGGEVDGIAWLGQCERVGQSAKRKQLLRERRNNGGSTQARDTPHPLLLHCAYDLPPEIPASHTHANSPRQVLGWQWSILGLE